MPVLFAVSFFVEGTAKSEIMLAQIIVSSIVLAIKVNWAISWIDARKHGVKLKWYTILGASPVHAIFTIVALIILIYASLWFYI